MSARFRRSFGALPELLGVCAEVHGLPFAAGVARALGGRKLWIPKPEHMTAQHPVAVRLAAQGLDLEDARAFAELYGGQNVDVPFGPFGGGSRKLSSRRLAIVRERLKAGEKRGDIAEGCDLTERRVYQIQRALKDDPEGSEAASDLFHTLSDPGET